MSRLRFLALALSVMPFMSAHAAGDEAYPAHDTSATTEARLEQCARQPDLLAFGLGYVIFDNDEPRTQSANFRFEYRWGYALWSYKNDWLSTGIRP
ncbi:MAG: hypothetical protein AB7H77_06560, partial [Bdellovibrionales bacterium]